jgi:ferredoxin
MPHAGPLQLFQVRLGTGGAAFDAAAGEPLLLAAARGGIELPSSCRNGTCRTCITRLDRGTVTYLVEWPGLLLEEKAQGWILPCVAVAASDLVITPGAAS